MSGARARFVEMRDFYPAAQRPLEAERADLKVRKRALDRRQNEARTRMERHAAISGASRKANTQVAVGVVVLGAVGLGALLGAEATKAWFFGLKDATGTTTLIPGAFGKTVFLAFQGALGASWVTHIKQKQKARLEDLERKRFQEWTTSVALKDGDLVPALLPSYVRPNPYNPIDDAFEFVIGEHYGTEGHKFSHQADWYGIPFEGLVTGGTVVFGISGSGKTAAVIKPFMRQVFGWKATVDYDDTGRGMEKCAGLVLDPKGSLSLDLKHVLASAGIDPVLEVGRVEDPNLVTLSPTLYQEHVAGGAARRKALFDGRLGTRLGWKTVEALRAVARAAGPSGQSLKRWADRQAVALERARHEAGLGAAKEKGRKVFRTERQAKPKRYRGRGSDYIELGYDEFRVNRIIEAHDRIQGSARALGALLGEIGGERKEASGGLNTWKTTPSRVLAMGGRKWTPKKEMPVSLQGATEALHGVLVEIERLVLSSFVASRNHQNAMASSVGVHDGSPPDLSILNGVPGTDSGNRDDMEAYADLRHLVRLLATTRERPGEDIGKYRLRWMAREARTGAYTHSLEAIIESFVSSVRRLEVLGGNHPELKSLIAEMRDFARLMRLSIHEALGEAGMESEFEFGRGEARVHPIVRESLQRIESYLPPAALADFKAGHMKAFRIYEGTLPSPRPRTEKEIKVLGNAYAAPDPLVSAIEDAGRMKVHEDKLASEIRAWISQVIKEQRSSLGLLQEVVSECATRIEQACEASEPIRPLRHLLDGVFEALLEDTLEQVPRHLGEAIAADLMAYPGRVPDEEKERESSPGLSLAMAYAGADLEHLECDFEWVIQEAIRKVVVPIYDGHDTHLYGAGPLGWILQHRFSGGAIQTAVSELTPRRGSSEVKALAEFGLRQLVRTVVESVCRIVATSWAKGPGGSLAPAALEQRLRAIWQEGQVVMRSVVGLHENGSIALMVRDMSAVARHESERAEARTSDAGQQAAPTGEVVFLLLFMRDFYRSFWGGRPNARQISLVSLVGHDGVWSTVFWKRLLLALQSAEKDLPGWKSEQAFVERLGDYHQAALDAFTYYVAPNSGFKTDGPFMFNPIHLPGLDVVNVAATFTKAVFGAMNKGGKSDPFWENAGNRLISSLLNATSILYGYSTFPILARLIGNKTELANVMKSLRTKREQRSVGSSAMLEIQNILNWYDGEWETPGADKGETKTNIIATLTVVTNAFLAAGYQIALAPQREADISFPSWDWVFKHGKVVGVNLPVEKHQGVAPVVLALLNKSFQKYIQLRDSQRTRNEALLKPDPRSPRGRLRIKELEAARKVVIEKTRSRMEWVDALSDWGNQDDGMAFGGDRQNGLLAGLLPDPGLLPECIDEERVSDALRTKSFRRPVIADLGFAFVLGVAHGRDPVIWPKIAHLLSIAATSAFRAGCLVRKVLTMDGLPWPRDFWRDDQVAKMGFAEAATANRNHPDVQAALRFLESADEALAFFFEKGQDRGRKLIEVGGGVEGFRKLFRDLPLALVLPKGEFWAQEIQKRLNSEKFAAKAELHDARKLYDRDTGTGLSLIGKIRDLTEEIRLIEDEIAMMPNTERYVVWCVDECHFYLEGETDAQYASVSRSNRAINLIATQGPSSIYSRMEEKTADALLINFPNRIILRQADAEEAETCANLLGGKRRRQVVDRNVTQSFDEMHGQSGEGRGSATGGSVQFTVKEEERFLVEPGILVDLPAFQGVAVSWDGYEPREPQKVWLKPDFLYVNPTLRQYDPDKGVKGKTGFVKLPKAYKRGEDLFAVTVLRLMELGILRPEKKGV